MGHMFEGGHIQAFEDPTDAATQSLARMFNQIGSIAA